MQDGHAQVLSEAAASNRKKAPGRCAATAWGLAMFAFCRMTRCRSEREQVQSRVRVMRSVDPHHDFIAKSPVFHRKPLLACQFSLWYFHNSTCIWRSVKMHLKILKESPGGKPLGLFAYLIKAAVEVLASVPQAAKQAVADAFSCAMNSTCYDNGGSYDRQGNHDGAYQVLIFFHFAYLHSVRFVMQYLRTNYTTNLRTSLPLFL